MDPLLFTNLLKTLGSANKDTFKVYFQVRPGTWVVHVDSNNLWVKSSPPCFLIGLGINVYEACGDALLKLEESCARHNYYGYPELLAALKAGEEG